MKFNQKAPAPAAKPAVTPAPAPAAAKPAVTVAPAAAKPAVTAPVATAPVVAAPVAAAKMESAVAVAETPKAKGEIGRDRSGVAALIARLRAPDAEIARDAATTLGTLTADAETIDALSAVTFNRDGFFHPVVRTAAAAALGRLGDRRAVDALITATRDPMAEASEEAVKALGLLGDSRALPALNAAVLNADGFFLEQVRKAARDAIRRIG